MLPFASIESQRGFTRGESRPGWRTGPVAVAIIGFYGYASVFLFALISVVMALGIVIVLKEMQRKQKRVSESEN